MKRDPALIALVVLSTLVFSVLLLTPLGLDNCVYQTIAIDYVRHGLVPYLGAWDQNFPGIFLFHILAIKLFGSGDIGVRALDAICEVFFVVVLYKFSLRWLSRLAAWLTAFFYVLMYMSNGIALWSQRDVFGSMALIVAVYLLYLSPPNRRWKIFFIISSAFLLGFSLIIRPTNVLLELLILALLPIPLLRGRIKSIILYGMLSAIPFAVSVIYYARFPDGLRQYYLAVIAFNVEIYAKVRDPHTIDFLLHLKKIWVLGLFGIFGPLVIFRKNEVASYDRLHSRATANDRWLFWGAIAITLISVWWQGKNLIYHYMTMMTALCAIAAVGAEYLLSFFKRPWREGVLIGCLIFAVYRSIPIAAIQSFGSELLHNNSRPLEASYSSLLDDPLWGFKAYDSCVRYMREPAQSTGLVETPELASYLSAHLGREPATRFFMVHPFSFTPYRDLSYPESARSTFQREWRKEYLETLVQKRPRFIILTRLLGCWVLGDPYHEVLQRLPGFDNFFLNNYHLDRQIGLYQIYRLNGA